MTTASQFLQKHKSKLIEKLAKFLMDFSSPEEIQKYVWDVIESGGELPPSEPYEKGEDVFWATIWAVQHLADENHIKLESTKAELNNLLRLLKNGGSLPEGWVGKRP